MRVKDEKITKKLKGKEKRGVIKGTENKEGHKNQIENWVQCETIQRALKACFLRTMEASKHSLKLMVLKVSKAKILHTEANLQLIPLFASQK
jgi:hypothetical protein